MLCQIAITVDDHQRSRLPDIQKELSLYGFESAKVLKSLGVLIGTCPPDALKDLEKVSGVVTIVEDREEFVATAGVI
jgi:hypothetical protein